MTTRRPEPAIRRSEATAAAGLALLSLILVSCSPLARVRSRLDLPAAVGSPDRKKLHVTFAASSTAGPLAPPPPGMEPPEQRLLAEVEVTPADTGFDVELKFRKRSVYVNLTGWYDSDDDGKVGTGDAVGSLGPAPVLAADKGVFSGNLTVTPPIALRPVP
ncbi:hypothetical protein BE21_07135 [Sorangium cellulosum]|uniref:Uncharacterized protein n=1 Tax=Sorangium cellulosum TaxID=56 RepID=A0A150T7Y2_SORCE|nr:hypothetical protein BE21_07135 [Sorangium cellulosum]